MKILFVIDSLHGGGAEQSLAELLPALREHRVDVSVVTLLPDDGSLERQVKEAGISVTRQWSRSPLSTAHALQRLMRTTRPDLVHTSLFRSDVLGRIASRSVGIPCVTSIVNDFYGPLHRENSKYGSGAVRGAQALDALTAQLACRFHAISSEVAGSMRRRLNIARKPIDVVWRGRDPSRLGSWSVRRRSEVRARLGIADDVAVVLQVSRLDKQKAVDTTIKAFARLLTPVPSALLLVAGRDGNAAADIHQMTNQFQGDQIRLLGHRTDVPDLMVAADVLAFPSRWEGLGGTVLEAMALRLPIVCSDLPVLRETLGTAGEHFVAVDDDAAFADALRSCLSNPTSAALLDQAEARFQAHFTIDASARGMVEFYRRAVPSVL
jgi:glycosyltransferase involved in cell wall biosynthesis